MPVNLDDFEVESIPAPSSNDSDFTLDEEATKKRLAKILGTGMAAQGQAFGAATRALTNPAAGAASAAGRDEANLERAQALETGLFTQGEIFGDVTRALTSPAAGAASTIGREEARKSRLEAAEQRGRLLAGPKTGDIYPPGMDADALSQPITGAIPTPAKETIERILSIPAAYARERLEMQPDTAPPSPILETVAGFTPSERTAEVLAGLGEAGSDLAGFFISPLGIATLGMGSLPAATQRAISLAFAAQMAKDTPELAKQLGEELAKPEGQRDIQKITKIVALGAANTGFTAMGGLHGLKPEPRVFQGPLATGEILPTPEGAPAPVPIPPPKIERVSPAEAAAAASRMTKTATAGYEPPPPGRPTVPEGPLEPPPAPPAPAAPEPGIQTWDDAVNAFAKRAQGNETIPQIQQMFPELRLNREAARGLAKAVFGEDWNPGGPAPTLKGEDAKREIQAPSALPPVEGEPPQLPAEEQAQAGAPQRPGAGEGAPGEVLLTPEEIQGTAPAAPPAAPPAPAAPPEVEFTRRNLSQKDAEQMAQKDGGTVVPDPDKPGRFAVSRQKPPPEAGAAPVPVEPPPTPPTPGADQFLGRGKGEWTPEYLQGLTPENKAAVIKQALGALQQLGGKTKLSASPTDATLLKAIHEIADLKAARAAAAPPTPAEAQAPAVSEEPAQAFAKESGLTFDGEDLGGIQLPKDLKSLPPEEQAKYAKLQENALWAFTDRRLDSPTKGVTFYTKKGATPAEIQAAWEAKRKAFEGTPTPPSAPPAPAPAAEAPPAPRDPKVNPANGDILDHPNFGKVRITGVKNGRVEFVMEWGPNKGRLNTLPIGEWRNDFTKAPAAEAPPTPGAPEPAVPIPPLPKAGEDLLSVEPSTAPSADVQRNQITRVLEKLETVDEKTGKISEAELDPDAWEELLRQAGKVLGRKLFDDYSSPEQAEVIKALRNRLAEIEQAKLKGEAPPAAEPLKLTPAIRIEDYDPITGKDHLEAYKKAKEGAFPDTSGALEGFVDQHGIWYTREEAAEWSKLPTETETGKLHSSDLPGPGVPIPPPKEEAPPAAEAPPTPPAAPPAPEAKAPRSIDEIQKELNRARGYARTADPTKKKGKAALQRVADLEEELRQAQEQKQAGRFTYWSREVNTSDISRVKPTKGAGQGERVKLLNGEVWEYKGISAYKPDNAGRVNGWEKVERPPEAAPAAEAKEAETSPVAGEGEKPPVVEKPRTVGTVNMRVKEQLEAMEPGQCFKNARKWAMKNGGTVVHGKLTINGERFDHAWVEIGNDVVDPTVGVRVDKSEFYKSTKAEVDATYAPEKVTALLGRVNHGGPYTKAEAEGFYLTHNDAAPALAKGAAPPGGKPFNYYGWGKTSEHNGQPLKLIAVHQDIGAWYEDPSGNAWYYMKGGGGGWSNAGLASELKRSIVDGKSRGKLVPGVEAPPAPEAAPEPAPAAKPPPTEAEMEEKIAELARLNKRQAELEQEYNYLQVKKKATYDHKELGALAEETLRNLALQKEVREAITPLHNEVFDYKFRKENAQYYGKPEPTPSEPKITPEVLKEQKESLMDQLTQAIKTAPLEGEEMITISVPGDGDFTVKNTKAALGRLRDIAKSQFPTKIEEPQKVGGRSKGRESGADIPISTTAKGTPTPMPKAKAVKAEELPKLVKDFVSTDTTRDPITVAYSDGTQIIATDGRQMLRIVTDRAPGTPAKPVRINEKGQVVAAEHDFPNFNQIWSDRPDLVAGGVKTDQLWTVANQARALWTKPESNENPSMRLFLNPDGSVGAISKRAGIGQYSHNLQKGARSLGHFNPEYVLNAADVARRLGNEKVDLYFHGKENGPLEFRGQNHASIVMPMKLGEGYGRNVNFGTAFPAHGTLEKGLGPLRDPDAKLESGSFGSGNNTYAVTLEGGKFTIDHSIPAFGRAERSWATRGTVDRTLDKARRREDVKEILASAGEKPSKETVNSVLSEMDKLDKRRQELVDEAAQREGKAPGEPEGGKLMLTIFPFQALKPLARPLEKMRGVMVQRIKNMGARHEVDQLADAMDNKARILGRQMGSRIRLGTPEVKDIGASAVIAAKFHPAELNNLLAMVAGKNAKAEAGIRWAMANFGEAASLAHKGQRIFNWQLRAENANAINTLYRENYLPGLYEHDTWMGNGQPFVIGNQGSGVASGFKKGKTYDSPFHAIADGYEPQSLRLSDLAEHRVSQGQRMINRKVMADALKTIIAPSDGRPVAADMIEVQRSDPALPSYQTAPRGYSPRQILPGHTLAIHDDFVKLFDAVTGSSSKVKEWEPGNIPVGELALQTEGLVKHGLLIFDTFHASRIMQKQMFLTKALPSYAKGHSLLEYSNADLNKAIAEGEITPEIADWIRTNRPKANLLISKGLNVGRIQEAMYNGIVRSLQEHLAKGARAVGVPKRIAEKIEFSKWVFEKVTRGAMLESGLIEFDRVKKNNPTWSDAKVASVVARDLNAYFGNLGRQGVFKSPTMLDGSRLALLAPQWVESMARSEILGAGQLAKGAVDSAMARRIKVGTLGTGLSQGLLAYFVGTQLLNLATRRQFTWQNPEKDHKLDAWVPDITGKSNGFFISPLSVVAELTHDMLRYAPNEKEEGGAAKLMAAAAHIATNRSSPLWRAGKILGTGKDWDGQKIMGGWNRVKAAAWAMAPTPIPLSPVIKGGAPVGQVQRQLMSSAGFKNEPAGTYTSQVHNLARDWMEKSADPKVRAKFEKGLKDEFGQSDYVPLRRALQGQDLEAARQEYDKLLEAGKKPADIQKTLRPYILTSEYEIHQKPITGLSTAETRKFLRSLSPEDKQLYEKAKAEQKALFQRFQEMLQKTKKPLPAPEGRIKFAA